MQSTGDLWQALSLFRFRVLDQMQGGLAALGLDLSTPQSLALTQVAEAGPLTIGALTAKLHRSQATVSHLVAQLELKGLVTRADDPKDARRTTVRLSRQGARLLARLERLRLQSFERVLGRVPAPTRRRLEAALWETLDALTTKPEDSR